MKNLSKRSFSLICILSLLTGLTACGPEVPDLSNPPAANSSADGSTSTAATAAETLKADISGSNIRMAFDNNFIVDASYSGPADEETDTLFCKVKEINEDTLINVLFDGDHAEMKNTTTGKSYISGKRKADIFQTPTESRISFQTDDFDRYGNVFQGEFDSDFTGSGELEFMSTSEAADLVKKTLDRFGIGYGDDILIQSYDLAALESLGNKGKALTEEKTDDPYADYIYQKEDEFYYITVPHTVGSVPVSRLSQADIGIYAAVSSKGIELLDICTILEKDEGSKTGSVKTVDAAKALQTLHDYYSENKKDKQIEVKNVSFRYYAKLKDDSSGFDLIPVWEIVSAFKTEDDKLVSNYAEIDASSGEFLTDPEGNPLADSSFFG